MSATAPGIPLAVVCLVLIAMATQGREASAQPHAANAPARSTPAARGDLPWASLSVAEQTALAPLKQEWPNIDHARKTKWLELAARFPSMPDAERRRVQARMTEWAQMSPEDRGRARLQFQETRRLSPEERKARWDAYMALPPEQRRALANRRAGAAAAPRPAGSAPSAGATSPPHQAAAGHGSAKARPVDASTPKAVSPALVQPSPGATTTLISSSPPSRTLATPARAGHPKVLSDVSRRLNENTLLPQPSTPAANAAPGSR